MDAVTAELPLAPTDTPSKCEHCGNPFEPRKGSGGKPQRFCRPECRQAFHANGQRDEQGPTCDAETTLGAAGQPDKPKPLGKAAAAETARDAVAEIMRAARPPEPDPFEWGRDGKPDDAVILPEQRAIAAYFNNEGELVLRQRNWPDDDSFIWVSPDNAQAFLDKICDLLGIGSAAH